MVEARIDALEAIVKRLEAICIRQEAALAAGAGGAAGAVASGGPASATVESFIKTMTPLVDDFRAAVPYMEDEEATKFADTYLNMLVTQGVVLSALSKFAQPTGTGQDYCKPFMCFFKDMPSREALDVHPRSKYPDFKKAIANSYSIFYWPQFKNRSEYLKADLVDSYIDGVAFWADKVTTKSKDEVEKKIVPKFMAICTAFVEFFKKDEKYLKWTGTEDIAGLEAFMAENTTPDKLKDFSNVQTLGGGSGSGSGSAPAGKAAPQKAASAQPSGGLDTILDAKCPADTISGLKDALSTFGSPQVTKLTEEWLRGLQIQKAVLATRMKFKKPADAQFLVAPIIEMSTAAKEVKDKDFKAPRWPVDSLATSFNLFMWPGMEDPAGLMEAADMLLDQTCYGLNQTALGTDDKAKEWASKFRELLTGFAGFLKTQADKGLLQWKGSEDPAGAEAFFKAQMAGAPASSAPAQAPAKVEEKKVAPTPAPVPAPKPAGAKPKPAAKPPSKKLVRNKWEIENYENETITLKEDELGLRIGLSVFNCKNTTFVLEGKLQSIAMIDCKNCELQVDRLISMCEIITCKNTRIVPKNQFKSCTLEKSSETKFVLNEATRDCQITLTSSKDTWVDVPLVSKDAEEPRANLPIADSFICKLPADSDEFVYEEVKGLE